MGQPLIKIILLFNLVTQLVLAGKKNKLFQFRFIIIWVLDNSLLIVGGGTKLYLKNHTQSPITDQAELYSCDGESVQLPDLPQQLFGASLGWDGESRITACGGATWKRSYSQCFQLDLRSRSMMNTWTQIADLNIKRAFGLLLWLKNEENNTKLYQFGGIDPITYKSIREVEVYDEDNDKWELHKNIPEDFSFPESPDYGCLGVLDNIIYSVGLDEIVMMDWSTWQVSQVLLIIISSKKIKSEFRLHNGRIKYLKCVPSQQFKVKREFSTQQVVLLIDFWCLYFFLPREFLQFEKFNMEKFHCSTFQIL